MRWRQAAISVGVVLLLLLLSPGRILGQWKPLNPVMFSNLWDSTEAFYRLGQHRAGVWNYHGESVDLSQANTNISVPMFLSSNGHGIL
jgi:hypothetical protein